MDRSANLDAVVADLVHHENYLDTCQVDTPHDVVAGFWRLVNRYRPNPASVLDMGAGDGRFARYGTYRRYVGYEIDVARLPKTPLPKGASMRTQCVFQLGRSRFSCALGNVPYVRHHDVEKSWLNVIADQIDGKLDIRVSRLANAYLYFLCQALIATEDDGLVALIMPYEWVSRPSARAVREYIHENEWNVDVYRFTDEIFPRVLTTASVTIIDKRTRNDRWRYFKIDRSFKKAQVQHPSGTRTVLKYSRRGEGYFSQRGLSPGHQKAFVLTESQRLLHSLKKGRDVVPCVTSLKCVPASVRTLTKAAFKKHFVDSGEPCWLVRVERPLSKQLQGYLRSVPKEYTETSTCTSRETWWKYKAFPVPRALYGSGFRGKGPKFLDNPVGAANLGSVHGLLGRGHGDFQSLLEYLRGVDFRARTVHHARTLVKVEVNQMNHVVQRWERRTRVQKKKSRSP